MDELFLKVIGWEVMLEKKVFCCEQVCVCEDSFENFKEKDVMGGGDDFQ